MTGSFERRSGDNLLFSIDVLLHKREGEIKSRVESALKSGEYPVFLWDVFRGEFFIRSGETEILGAEGLDASPIVYAQSMFERSEHYLSPDNSKFSKIDDPVTLLMQESEGDMDWINKHSIAGRQVSIHPFVTISRKGGKIEFSYLDGKKPMKAYTTPEDYVAGVKDLASKVQRWAKAAGLPHEHPPFGRLYESIEKAQML